MAIISNLLPFLILTTALLATPSSAASPTLVSTILSTLGQTSLSAAAENLTFPTPATIFAPTAASLSSCPSCNLPLLLLQHSLPGLYPLRYLQTLAFATKIETLSPNHCLTVTSSSTTPAKIFINGNEVTKPDLFNNGVIIVHSLQGFIAHLSPSSCLIQSMTTLSFPDQPPVVPNSVTIRRRTLKYAMSQLRDSGHSVVALAMAVRNSELSRLESMTLFAIDDESIFADGGEGHAYVADLGFHIVPNRVVTREELAAMPIGTMLPTLDVGRSLVVTTAGDGSPVRPVRINYEKVKRFDLVWHERIVVHGLSVPFRHVDWPKGTVGSSNHEGFVF